MNHPTRRLAAGVVAALLALATAFSLSAGAQTVPGVDITRPDLTEFPTVQLNVALSGEALTENLDPADIVLTENGDPIEIAELVPLSDDAVDVVLTIDISGSMDEEEALDQAKVAAAELIDELPDDARVAVVSFGNSANVVSEFTTDRDATRNAIDGLNAGGATTLYDAVVLSAEQIDASDAPRTAVVVLSDGGDTDSDADLAGAVSALGAAETDFFAVSLGSDEVNEAALADLASAAGGLVVPAADPGALAAAFTDLGQRIVNQYRIVFESVTDAPTATFAVSIEGTDESASTEVALPDRPGGAAQPEEEAGPLVVEPLVTEGDASPFEQDWVLFLGAVLVAAALAVTAWVVMPSGQVRQRRRSLRSDRPEFQNDASSGERIVQSVREGVTGFTTRAVERSAQGRSIDAALDRAGLVIRAGEFVALVLAAVVAATLVLGLLMGVVGLVLGVVLPIALAPTFLNFLASRRNAKFADQLPDTLQLMAGSLRSGFGIGQAIDQVAEEMDPPIADEFQRAVLETRLGRDVEDALNSISARVQNEDFEWVVDAMRIHRTVGGDLSQILEKVSQTIRARNKLKRQIRALTAEGRLSGIVLASLPVLLALFLFSSNPDYMDPLFDETLGRIMLGGGIFLLLAGGYWLKRLVDVEL